MSYLKKAVAVAALSFAAVAFAPIGSAGAADLDKLPVKAKPIADVPFFLVNDNVVTFSYIPNATDPGAFSAKPGGGFNGTTAKQVVSFTHFDVWAYGTNFFDISMFKSDHNDPAAPCTNAGVIQTNFVTPGTPANCAGATEIYGLIRSTFGWNEIFNTKQFSIGPLHNISFEIGADANSENTFLAPAKRDLVAGLQFAFDLPYKGFFNVSPLAYKEINHNSFDQCGTGFVASQVAGLGCLADGNTDYKTTWALETNYYMDLGFPPPSLQYFSISGRAAWYGPKGDENAPLVGVKGVPQTGFNSTATKTEFNSEPIRLTFDASKAIWGSKYGHFVDVWVAYRYWQNKFGLDHAAAPGICTIGGVSTNTCTESSVNTGITVKF